MAVPIAVGQLFRDTNSSKVYWCDNPYGTALLRWIVSADVLNGIFNGPFTDFVLSNEPVGATIPENVVLIAAWYTEDVYFLDCINGTWLARFITDMNVFGSRHFAKGAIQSVPAGVVLGLAKGPEISS